MHLRAFQLQDVAKLCELEQTAHIDPWGKQAFIDSINDRYATCVMCLNEELIGYSVIFKGVQEWELLNVTVCEQQRSKGYARILLEQAIKQARSAGMLAMLLEVRPSNTPALKLYTGLGFERLAVRRHYYKTRTPGVKEDALVMRLEL